MPTLMLDSFATIDDWAAFQADGSTPSTDLGFAADAALSTPSGDSRSLRIDTNPGSLEHRLRRDFSPALDLSGIDELCLVVRGEATPASVVDARNLLDVRLGSAAAPIDSPGNGWHRHLHLYRSDAWETLRLFIGDLPGAVRGAVSRIELRHIEARDAGTWHFDEILGHLGAPALDVETALAERLHERFDLDGTPVPASVQLAGADEATLRPLIAIWPDAVTHVPERLNQGGKPRDRSLEGYRLSPAEDAYAFDFAIEPLAATRREQAEILDFLLGELAPMDSLRIAGRRVPLEILPPLTSDPAQPFGARQHLRIRVVAWRQRGIPIPATPVQTVNSTFEWRTPTHGQNT